jgi:hypothetical protein
VSTAALADAFVFGLAALLLPALAEAAFVGVVDKTLAGADFPDEWDPVPSLADWPDAPLIAAFNCDENAPGAPDAWAPELASAAAASVIIVALTRETGRMIGLPVTAYWPVA